MNQNDSLLIELACARVMIRTNHCADRHDIDTFIAQFADDAILYRAGQPFAGVGAIRALMESRSRSRVTRHLMGAPLVEVTSEEEATGRASFVIFDAIDEDEGAILPLRPPALLGEYRQDYRRIDGAWKIVRFDIDIVFQPVEAR